MTDLTPVGNPEVNAELARRVAARRPPPPEPFIPPEPEVRARLATELEVASCKSAHRLEAKALEAGWTVLTTYSRGPWIASDGASVLDTVDTLLLRFSWDGRTVEAAALWVRRTGKGWALETARTRDARLSGLEIGYWLTGEAPPVKKKKAA